MRTLIYLPYSPWSEKARWALDHHGIDCDLHSHVPFAGELPLRLRTRRLRGRVSVPVLLTENGALFESFEIAQYAEERGRGAPLFPPRQVHAIADWNVRSEAALAAGRKAALRRALTAPDALEEGLQPLLPRPLRRPLRPLARSAVAFMQRKYATERADESALIDGLDALRAALARSGRYVLGSFTYADIAMAAILQFVRPVADAHLALAPATRRTMSDESLAARYPELLTWRDELYARHRRPELAASVSGSVSESGSRVA